MKLSRHRLRKRISHGQCGHCAIRRYGTVRVNSFHSEKRKSVELCRDLCLDFAPECLCKLFEQRKVSDGVTNNADDGELPMTVKMRASNNDQMNGFGQ